MSATHIELYVNQHVFHTSLTGKSICSSTHFEKRREIYTSSNKRSKGAGQPTISLQIIEREKVTTWSGVPTMALDIMEHPSFSKYDTSSLLSIGAGGAPTPASQVRRTAELFKNGLPTTAYGLTETNGAVCVNSTLTYIHKPTSCGT